LLHFADLHLGVENYGTLDPRSGLSSRVQDFLRSLDRIVDRAMAERVDAVLFAGDAFKNRDPSPTIQREFARRVARLADARIPIVLLVGNHDLPNALVRATPTEIYQVLNIPHVFVCRDIETIMVPTNSGTLQVVALPWVTRSLFLADEGFRALAETDLDQAMAEAISGALEAQIEQLDASLPAVLLAHVSLQGATLGHEQSIMLGRDVTVGREELHAPAFDYIALGHIHKHQVVGTNPPAVYAGSPERIDFGEEREAKGFVLVTIESNGESRRTASWRFEELAARPFKTLRITARGDEPMEAIARELQNAERLVAGAIVRCFVTVDAGRERSVSSTDVRRALLSSGATYVAQVVVESATVTRARLPVALDHARDSDEMLRRWVEMKEYDAALRERVLAKGREIIAKRRQRFEGGSGERG
jgi:exonuclease SbcD